MESKLKHDIAYMKIAQTLSELSYSRRSKVGCVIVSEDGQIISQGWNGMPKGMPNCCEHEENGQLVTNKEVLHAESNAITKCAKWGTEKIEGSTAYVTLSPCMECSKLLLQVGIKRVVYLEKYRILEGLQLLKNMGVEINYLDITSDNGPMLFNITNVYEFGGHWYIKDERIY